MFSFQPRVPVDLNRQISRKNKEGREQLTFAKSSLNRAPCCTTSVSVLLTPAMTSIGKTRNSVSMFPILLTTVLRCGCLSSSTFEEAEE